MKQNKRLERASLLMGHDAMQAMQQTRVLLVGVGGVGGWCAEALVRSGIGHITLVDSDCVCESNINRQLVATTTSIGMPKVEVLKSRLLEINPDLSVESIHSLYTQDTAEQFNLDSYHYVIDAIDSLGDKALLILNACNSRAKLYSSMGAALKTDITRIRTAEFWKVSGCRLAAALRRYFKSRHRFPSRKFTCVYSDEIFENRGTLPLADNEKMPNGTLMHTTATFGLLLAQLVVNDVMPPLHKK